MSLEHLASFPKRMKHLVGGPIAYLAKLRTVLTLQFPNWYVKNEIFFFKSWPIKPQFHPALTRKTKAQI